MTDVLHPTLHLVSLSLSPAFVQDALDAVSPGDTIILSDGDYWEDVQTKVWWEGVTCTRFANLTSSVRSPANSRRMLTKGQTSDCALGYITVQVDDECRVRIMLAQPSKPAINLGVSLGPFWK